MGETPSYEPYGEADSHLEEVVPGIAFPLTALSELLKYLPLLLGAYMKAGKVLLQAYYSLTLKHSPPSHTWQHWGMDFIWKLQLSFRPPLSREGSGG